MSHAMIEDVSAALRSKGFEDEHIHTESSLLNADYQLAARVPGLDEPQGLGGGGEREGAFDHRT
jgi:hypothetical protein